MLIDFVRFIEGKLSIWLENWILIGLIRRRKDYNYFLILFLVNLYIFLNYRSTWRYNWNFYHCREEKYFEIRIGILYISSESRASWCTSFSKCMQGMYLNSQISLVDTIVPRRVLVTNHLVLLSLRRNSGSFHAWNTVFVLGTILATPVYKYNTYSSYKFRMEIN